MSFIEDMHNNGNDKVKDIVKWTLLEYLLCLNDDVKRQLYKYLPQSLCEATKEVECYIEDMRRL
jgi:hypothetical protein